MNNNQLELWKNLKSDNTLMQVQQYIKDVITLRGFSVNRILRKLCYY